MNKFDKKVQKRVEEHYDYAYSEFGDRLVGVFLQGSQNYGPGMSDELSDVDTKALLMPTKRQLLGFDKWENRTHVFDDGTEEHLDIKCINEYLKILKDMMLF